MNILRKHSLRRKRALLHLVISGEYSLGYALYKVEELYDNGKLVDEDYNELADYIDELMNKTDETLNDNLEVTSSDEEE